MKRKLLSIVLSLAMVMTMESTAVTASAAENATEIVGAHSENSTSGEKYRDYEFTVTDDKVTIANYTGSDSEVEIPNTIGGKPVTCIGYNAFSCTSSLTKVTIPDSVTIIGKEAFSQCRNLEKITIPSSVETIGEKAFSYCTSLIRVSLPDSVKSIGIKAFYNCPSLAEVTIPDSVTSMGDDAFKSCVSLTSITIPNNITSISAGLFDGCTNLSTIYIPDSVTSIGSNAFHSCDSLTSIIIPDSVTSIGSDAFCSCDSLTSIIIPDSVTSIGESAFYSCSALTSVTISDSVTSIEDYTFDDCISLKNITIPDSVTWIGYRAFLDCKSLSRITIPNSVTEIGKEAFSGYMGKNSITDIYYTGTEEQWINIENDGFKNAELHYVKDIYCTVTWKNYDGSVIKTLPGVEHGTIPDYEGETPDKPKTAQYSYKLKEWNNEIEEKTGNVTCTAVFKEFVNKYKVTWKNDDGTTLKTDTVEYGATPIYGSNTPVKEKTAKYTYTFNGWDKKITPVTGDVSYTAQFDETINEYTVTWQNEDGAVLKIETLDYGTTPKYNGVTPTKEKTAQYSYTFTGWDTDITPVTEDVTYTAEFKRTVNTYTVKWKDFDGTVLETDENVEYGTIPAYDGEVPNRALDAQYSYTFSGWDKQLNGIIGDVTFTAEYTKTVNTYTVKWKDNDGTIFETDDNVVYGTMPTYDGETPTKPSDEKYEYTFKGWDKEITEVTEDVTYTAQWETTPVVQTPDEPEFKLGDVNNDGKVTAKDSMVIQRYTINLVQLTDEQLKAADINGDGKATSKDALSILRFTVGYNVEGLS